MFEKEAGGGEERFQGFSWKKPLSEHQIPERTQPLWADRAQNFRYLIKSNKLDAICLLKNETYLFTNVPRKWQDV